MSGRAVIGFLVSLALFGMAYVCMPVIYRAYTGTLAAIVFGGAGLLLMVACVIVLFCNVIENAEEGRG